MTRQSALFRLRYLSQSERSGPSGGSAMSSADPPEARLERELGPPCDRVHREIGARLVTHIRVDVVEHELDGRIRVPVDAGSIGVLLATGDVGVVEVDRAVA